MALAFLHKCISCSREIEGYQSLHFCVHCGQPQPMDPSGKVPDYFSVFGIEKKFKIDLKDLEKRYYQLSRALHPDRFANSDPSVREASLKRTSLINQAYLGLKDRSSLRKYILELENVKNSVATQSMPADLAESWFEIQELQMEDPVSAVPKISEFKTELKQRQIQLHAELESLELAFDNQSMEGNTKAAQTVLIELACGMERVSFLNSLERDVERIVNGSTNRKP